ncbi:MAG: histidine kinase, partial [Actinomycetota bacterium]|nr:histidine kinase [Actinomycetota bacterium]
WMGLAALPLAMLIAATTVAAVTHHDHLVPFLAGGFVALLPVAAGLSVIQYRLYDIDRLLSRALTYVLLSGIVVGCYVGVVVVLGRILTNVAGHSQIAAVMGTLAAITLARPARADLQEALDRRYNRRQFDAVRVIQRYVRDPSPDVTVEEALRQALDDPSVDVAYWIAERGCWVTEDGNPTGATATGIDVRRRGESVASVAFDSGRSDTRIVHAVVAEARPELENARLRAAVALQLVEVRASRSRIVAAQLAERQKIERNLHDGAQQRLLALGLQLRAAEVSADPERPRLTLAGAVEGIQTAVAELRDLANGLHPSVLSDGGLAA